MPISLRHGQVPADGPALVAATTVTRALRNGKWVSHESGSAKRNHERYSRPYTVNFPDIFCRTANNVTIYDNYLCLYNDELLVDHLTFSLGRRSELYSSDAFILSLEKSLREKIDSLEKNAAVEDELTLVVHNEGGGTWGHWLIQNLPKILLFLTAYPSAKVALPEGYRGSNYEASARAYGITDARIVRLRRDRPTTLRRAAFLDPLYRDEAVHPLALDLLRDVKHQPQSERSSVLFVKRNSGGREIANWAEIENALNANDIPYRSLGSAHFEEQVAIWRCTDKIAAVLGSDFSSIIFAQHGSSVVSISPNTHGDVFFMDLAAATGVIWNEIICGRIVEKLEPLRRSSFYVPPDPLIQFMRFD
jgi:hypothetical protein